MITLTATAVAGLSAGLLHVVSGADHVAAVGPLAVSDTSRPSHVGAAWGAGHGAGVLGISAVALALGERFPLAMLSAVAERLVGVMLIVVGVWSLVRIRVQQGDVANAGGMLSAPARTAARFGVLHGAAGSAHLLGVLPALILPTFVGRIVYLLSFGMSAAVTMSVVTTLISRCGRMLGATRLLTVASLSGIVVGFVWLL